MRKPVRTYRFSRHPGPRNAQGRGASSRFAEAKIRQQLREEAPRLTSTNGTVTAAWRTAVGDLATMPLGTQDGMATPAAGYPLYQYLFGRDCLATAWQASMAMSTCFATRCA